MPEPLARTSDVPDFDAYPASAPAEAGATIAAPEHELPPYGNPKLNQAAEAVGHKLGDTVVAARQVQGRLRDAKARVVAMPIRARAESALEELRYSADSKLDELRHGAESKLDELRHRAETKFEDWKRSAEGSIEDVRGRIAQARTSVEQRAARAADEHPVGIILAAGAAAFAAGIALGLWRSRHD